MLLGSAPLSLLGVQIASSFSDSAQSTMSKVVGAALILGGIGFATGASCGFVVGLTLETALSSA